MPAARHACGGGRRRQIVCPGETRETWNASGTIPDSSVGRCRYVGNTFYNIYNKKACSNIHAHWTVAFAQLVVGVVWSVFTWMTFRKAPKISGGDWMKLAPIGLFAAAAHGGSVLAMGAGAVSFAQIVKACEPVYVALLCLVVPPIEVCCRRTRAC